MDNLIPILALAISTLTFVLSLVGMKYKANSDYVGSIESRVAVLEHKLRECEQAKIAMETTIKLLKEENYDILKRDLRQAT